MALNRFLSMLFEHGCVQVGEFAPLDESDRELAAETLIRFEAVWRLNAPTSIPELNIDAAMWGAEQFYRCCQFAVQREIDADTIAEALNSVFAERHDPSAHYAVDLTLRFLPDLSGLVAGFSPGDPLVQQLAKLGKDWPLSSVGVKGIRDVNIDALSQSDGLMQMYVDRVLTHRDLPRAEDARTRQWIHRTLGYHVDLVGDFSLTTNAET